jgi:hypothetical protein
VTVVHGLCGRRQVGGQLARQHKFFFERVFIFYFFGQLVRARPFSCEGTVKFNMTEKRKKKKEKRKKGNVHLTWTKCSIKI